MLDERSGEYARQARDLARRGWLAVVAMRRGYGGSDGPASVPLTCASTSLLERFAADADDLQAVLAAVAKRPDADGGAHDRDRRLGGWRGGGRALGAQSAGARLA